MKIIFKTIVSNEYCLLRPIRSACIVVVGRLLPWQQMTQDEDVDIGFKQFVIAVDSYAVTNPQ